MMPRVARGLRRWAVGTVLGAILLAGWVGSVAATVFDTPPVLGDRRVELTWPPDSPDDPVFNGNTVLRVDTTYTHLHGVGRAVRLIVSSSNGSTAYSLAEGESSIRAWHTADGGIAADLPLQPAGEPAADTPVALAIHASDSLMLGALPNGDLRLWRLDRPDSPVAREGHGGVRAMLFFPGIRDVTSLAYVSVGTDDTLRVWRRPGESLGGGWALSLLGVATGALDITSDRKMIAVGMQDGTIRVYAIDIDKPQDPPRSPLVILGQNVEDRHRGAITGLTFTKGHGKLASVDATGQVRVWRIPEGGAPLATVETGSVAPFIAFSSPDGRLLYVTKPDGTLELRNSDTGDIYRSEPVLLPAGVRVVTRSILTTDGVRTLVGDDDGRITVIRAGGCRPGADEASCFGGYMIWRSRTTRIEDAVLLRVYNYSDSTWTFQGSVRAFSDPDSIIPRKNPIERNQDPIDDFTIAGPSNGIPYFYSVTRFDLRYLGGGVFPVFPDSATQGVWAGFYRDHPGDSPTPLVAAASPDSVAPLLGQVIVVPNPFDMSEFELNRKWSEEQPAVEFRKLPDAATIRIYTLGGDLVRVIEHGRGRYQEARDTSSWDLRNSSGKRVTSGVYVYQVVTPAGNNLPGEVMQGYFTVVF